jgi:hypothetical protein
VVETDELKIVLALEPRWTVLLNELDFLPLASSEISIDGANIRFCGLTRQITHLEWLRPDVVRLKAAPRFRSQPDTITLYPGNRLPSAANLRRRRRGFQIEIGKALCAYFGVRRIKRQTLYSDRRLGVGGAYPRFLLGEHAAIAVDPDESSAVINGLIRAALLWKPLIRRPLAAVIPFGRHQCILTRLRAMPEVRRSIQWLQWDGSGIQPLEDSGEQPETHVQPFERYQTRRSAVRDERSECKPDPERKRDSAQPQARAQPGRDAAVSANQERLLQSNLIGAIRQVLPSIDVRHIYPQVPSFVGEERNIIDLLTITRDGRLVVIEIKASPDPDLPFQALDYWIAVERHRKAGDFHSNGYFSGCVLDDRPALFLMVAPLLAFHKTSRQLISFLPPNVPIMEIGINQTWKREIKVLRRKGMVS